MQRARAKTFCLLCALWTAAALASRADAASLYKCSDGEGRISYQSAPCASGATQVWERALAPDARLAAVVDAEAGADREAPRRRSPEMERLAERPVRAAERAVRLAVAAPRARAPRKSASRACQGAKAADAAYRAQPLSRVTHDGLRRHGDRIRLACGPG